MGIYCFTGFVFRLSIAEKIGQRLEEKIGAKDVDIVPFIRKVLDWSQKKQNIFNTEKCLILNFG